MRDIRICILQRGWVLVGEYQREGERCSLTNGCVVRRWGTSWGLGELAIKGPTDETVLDPVPDTQWHVLTEVMTMVCSAQTWTDALANRER